MQWDSLSQSHLALGIETVMQEDRKMNIFLTFDLGNGYPILYHYYYYSLQTVHCSQIQTQALYTLSLFFLFVLFPLVPVLFYLFFKLNMTKKCKVIEPYPMPHVKYSCSASYVIILKLKGGCLFLFIFFMGTGNRGPGRTPLDWTTRLKIAAGAARGLAFIHNSCRSLKLTHGNIKSTNILLDKTGNAHVSDFGLSVFAAPTNGGPRSNGYRAPESSDGRKLTQKSDVYSFGVLLLELLTGKCPSVVDNGGGPGGGGYISGVVDLPRWVQSVVREEWTAEVFDLELMRYKDIEEEMVGLLQIAMSCTAASPDQRPKMSHVVKMIDEIRGVEVSPGHDTVDYLSESPSMSEDTCGASQ